MGTIQSRQMAMGYLAAGQRTGCGNCVHAAENTPSHYEARRLNCNLGAFFVTVNAVCNKHESRGAKKS